MVDERNKGGLGACSASMDHAMSWPAPMQNVNGSVYKGAVDIMFVTMYTSLNESQVEFC